MVQPYILKVMLIEDDPQFVYLVERYARASGCQFVHTKSAGEVVSIAKQENPDLILLDITVGESSGSQILQALKADPLARRLTVYVCSASEAGRHEYEGQADGWLLKPVMYEDFQAVLKEIKPVA
jgi:CheY-like chemotaxis protein